MVSDSGEGVLLRGPDTRMGMLQRGRGLIARDADAHSGIGADILECVCQDPRWDHQAEERSHYYAGLIHGLDLNLGTLRSHLFNPDDLRRTDHSQPTDYWRTALTVSTLGALSRRGRTDARELLRDYAVTGANWDAALDELADDPDPAALGGNLQRAVLDNVDDDLLRDVTGSPFGPWKAWSHTSPRVARARTAALARRSTNRPSLDATSARLTELRTMVKRPQPFSRPAAAELARRGDSSWLLQRLEAVIADTDRPFAPPGLFAAVRELPAEPVLTWAREHASHRGTGWAMMLLAQHATEQDIPLLIADLHLMIDTDNWSGAVTPTQALGRLHAGDATPLLTQAWTLTPYAYLRPRLLQAQLDIDANQARPFLAEGLWDSQSQVRELTLTRFPRTTANIERARQLRDDPTETARTWAAASTYLDGSN